MPSYGLEIKMSAFWFHPKSHVGYLIPSVLLLRQNKDRTKTNSEINGQINGKYFNSDKSTK